MRKEPLAPGEGGPAAEEEWRRTRDFSFDIANVPQAKCWQRHRQPLRWAAAAVVAVGALALVRDWSGGPAAAVGCPALAPPAPPPPPGPVDIPGLLCVNPQAVPGAGFDGPGSTVASNSMPAGWQLVQGVLLQRHLDRWIYKHSLVYNHCWPGQLDSRAAAMHYQCEYNRSTVWEDQPGAASLAEGDPYVPAWAVDRDNRGGGASGGKGGSCFMDAQGDPQLTVQGRGHASALGAAVADRWRRLNLLPAGSCAAGAVALASDGAQKNTLTLQVKRWSTLSNPPPCRLFGCATGGPAPPTQPPTHHRQRVPMAAR